MKKMTPREALYNICIELGPAQTLRDDNLTGKEARLRDSIRTLQNFILYHDDSELNIPDSADEYKNHDELPSGKERIDKWRDDWKKHIQ